MADGKDKKVIPHIIWNTLCISSHGWISSEVNIIFYIFFYIFLTSGIQNGAGTNF
jgi:hypothetical protein